MNEENGNAVVPSEAAGLDPTVRATSIRTGGRSDPAAPRAPKIPFGAELPIFCERCGYSLNALPQIRCDHCTLLQFHCPECGHHQPINTLRPAMQRTLGRLRAWFLGLIVFFKLNWFGWHAFFWVLMGHEWAFTYDYRSNSSGSLGLTVETALAFGIYAGVVGFVSRMLLLRWKSGALVGVVLGAIICTMLVLGFQWRIADNIRYGQGYATSHLITPGRMIMTFYTFAVLAGSAALAWPVWTMFVRVAMPERAGSALLEWQRSLSDREPKTRLSDQP